MSSLSNVFLSSQSMNGLNTINADEITTDQFSAVDLECETLEVFGSVTLPANSILDAYLSSNVALKNSNNTFTAQQTFTGGVSATASQTIDFGSNAPIMSGANITGLSSGFVDLTTNQTVGGVKTFTDNLRAQATTGDVFQGFKNTGVGNAGHVLINGEGNLLYYDSTALATKWKLDTDGKLTIGNIDISGTLINKTTTAGSYIRSNSNPTGYFYASNNGDIGYTDSTAGIGNRWFINATGVARFISSSNSFKYWEFAGNVLRYWNLSGGGFSINMNGDTGAITTTGTISGTVNYGTVALRVGTTGTYSQKSIAIGTTSFGTAIQSVAIGDQSLNASGSTANYSVAIGVNSLALATGERNTAIGTDSLPLLTGTLNGANTAIGNLTGTKLTGGTTNLFLGLGSGSGITSGSNNLIVGSSMFASVSPDTGTGIDNNICVGSNAMGYIKDNCNANTAIGSYALYSELGYGGFNTVAIGGNAGVRSQGNYCTFIGNDATVDVANSSYNYSTAIGYGALISASNQISIGTASQNTIIGGALTVGGTINSGATTTLGNISCGTIGCSTITSSGNVSGVNITASGNVNGVNLNATGDVNALTGSVYGVTMQADTLLAGKTLDLQGAVGQILFTGGNAPIRIGTSTTSSTATANNMSIGNSSSSTGGGSIAIGSNTISNDRSIAIGQQAQANNAQSIGIGHLCLANGQQGVGIGEGALASSLQVVAVGAEAEATNTQCIAIGFQAKTANDDGISIGAESRANGNRAISLGFQATANFSNAVSIGDGVACTAVNQFRLGNASHNILVSQTYYPYEISPTTITGTSTLPGAPLYGFYLVATTSPGAYTLTIPTIQPEWIGYVLNFRKTNANAWNSTMSITCAAGNTYFPLNSVAATAAGVPSGFIGGTSTTGRILIINATQFGVLN